jgi:hypothetical protein
MEKKAPDRLRHLYVQTKNPLYVWEAIYQSLSADEPIIPRWCIPYLHKTAYKLKQLASGHDFKLAPKRGLPWITPDQAMQLVPAALAFSTQGKRNAFAALRSDRRNMDEARNASRNALFNELALKSIEKKRTVTRDRAKRIIAQGKRLLRPR